MKYPLPEEPTRVLQPVARAVSRKLPEYEFRGGFFLHPTREEVLAGVCFDRYRGPLRFLHWFVMPLAPPSPFIFLTYGKRFPLKLGRVFSDVPILVSGTSSDIEKCVDLVTDACRGFVEPYASLPKLWDLIRDRNIATPNSSMVGVYAKTMSGEWAEALAVAKAGRLSMVPDSSPWYSRLTGQYDQAIQALEGPEPSSARKLFSSWRDETRRMLGV